MDLIKKQLKALRNLRKRNSRQEFGFDEKIHEMRGVELERLLLLGQTALHIGCAGDWYFEFIDEKLKHTFNNHIGVEKYSDKPNNLPLNVRWLERCAGYFPEVPANSVDWIYSGQNLEHLWEEDFVDFFLESSRVAKFGAIISLDTPNSIITEEIAWNHPQHTAEFKPSEVQELLVLAGFEVLETRGIYKADFNLIPRQRLFIGYDNPIEEKNAWKLANSFPEESFIFWINAKKVSSPNVDLFKERAAQIFRIALERRTNRLQDASWSRLQYLDGATFRLLAETPAPATMSLAIPPGMNEISVRFSGDGQDIKKLLVRCGNEKLFLSENSKNQYEGKVSSYSEGAIFGHFVSIDFVGIKSEVLGSLRLDSEKYSCHRI